MSGWWESLWGVMQAAATPVALLGLLVGVTAFVARAATKSFVEGSIQHRFAKELEAVRAELRRTEEEFRSALRLREAEVTSLQSALLSGQSQRLALLDKRRVEAVEAIWTSVGALAPAKGFAGMVAVMNLPDVAKHSKTDPKIKQFMTMLTEQLEVCGKPNLPPNPVKDQPFVSPLAWAYYAAYAAVCGFYYVTAKVIAIGITNAINDEPIRRIVLAALPQAREHIEQFGPSSFYFWLDTLEELLLAELRRNLQDPSIDQQRAEQAKAIMAAVGKFEEEKRKTAASASQGADPA